MNRTVTLAAAALTALLASASVAGAQTTPLAGQLHISGATAIDPPPNEPKNTHAAMTIDGPAALRLYRTMKAKEQPDACMDKGWRTKFAGPLFCSLAPNRRAAKCFLTVSLIDGTTHSSRAGC